RRPSPAYARPATAREARVIPARPWARGYTGSGERGMNGDIGLHRQARAPRGRWNRFKGWARSGGVRVQGDFGLHWGELSAVAGMNCRGLQHGALRVRMPNRWRRA